MVLLRTPYRVVGVLVLLLGVGVHSPSMLLAQDRSVPRFGPLAEPDTVEAGTFDVGRVWSFAQPPFEYLQETYGISADERGLRHARRGTVRFPDCSGALVSDEGLVLTAARCVRDRGGGDVPADSFLAEQAARERSLSGMYADRVVGVDDVSARVDSVRGQADEAGWRAAVAQIQEDLQSAASEGQRVEVSREGEEPRYVAYTYRRYDDVRLVFLPNPQVTALGGPESLLSYPQHAWDVAALRIYEDGRPLPSSDHLEIRLQGARPGDSVFAVGFPSETHRGASQEQTAFWHEVMLPARHELLAAWTSHLQTYADTAAASEWEVPGRTAHAEGKRVRARLEALGDDYFSARLRARDEQLRRQAGVDSSRASEVGGIFEELASLQEEKRTIADSYRAFSFVRFPEYGSATVRRALLAYRAAETGPPDVLDTLEAIPSQPGAIDAAMMREHWEQLREHLSADSALFRALDRLEAPPTVVQQSVFSEREAVRSLVQRDALPSEDPLLDLVSLLHERYEAFEREWASLLDREQALTDALTRERHRQLEHPVALPHARAPRFADGRVRSYSYNGTIAPPFTTFYGLYGQHASFRTERGGDLPAPWRSPPEAFDRSTPLAIISSTDMGGEYGGPLLNTSLELVGLRYDENVQSAAGTYLFLPQRMRSVAVDVRGVLEGLSSTYGANDLVREIEGRPGASQ